MANKTISNTFVVNTVDDPVGLVAQYCATATPTQSSQIHTSFQTGDLYMRTRTTEETFSGYVDPNHPWNKIVGESGGETNYQFAISANKVSQDGTSATAPTDISSSDWHDAPLIVTTAKPYLWSKVQKKDGGGNNVGNPSYMRLTGEESIEYSVEGALNTIKVGAGQTSTLVSCTYTFYQKPAVSSTRSTVSCYYAVYLRSGNTFSLLTMGTGYNNHGSGTSVTVSSNVPYKSGSIVYNAVVIYILPSSYYSTSPESQNYMAKKEIPIVKDGDTAFVVDLENEMTNVALDENGNLIANFDMYFKVRAYYGTTNVLSDSACSVSASCSNPNVTITDTNAKTTGIRVQISSGTHILDTTEVSVTVTHTTYGTRTVIFTLAGVRGGENAVLQELLPSLDAISFARTASGGLTPSSRDLTLSIKKTQGGSTSTQSISDSGLTIRWSSTSMPASKTGGNGWGNGTATGIYFNNTTMQIANTVAATNIYIAAFNSAGTLVDRETIPVIKDGEKGEKGDSVTVDTQNSKTEYVASNQGTSAPTSGWTTTIPSVPHGQFLWTRVTTVYSDGSSTVSYGVSYNANDGEDGADGTSVTITSKSVKYAVTNNGTQPADSSFIYNSIPSLQLGQYLWTKTEVAYSDGNSTKAYSVSRLGTDGEDGQAGADGYTTHFAYATSADGSQGFSTTNFNGATYIGTYRDKNATDSTNYRDYTWTEWKGDKGDKGEQGDQGEKGDKGDDALTLALDTYAISFPTDSDYNVGSALTYTVGVKMFLGNNTQQTITSISPTSSDEGVTVSSISNGVRIVVGEEIFVNSITVTVTAVCAKGTRTAKIILTAAPKGAKGDKGNDGIDGARGKVGRFFYFGGTFDSLNTTQTFIVNDAQAPYFEHTVGGQKRYHVFNYETNGSYTMSQMWAISSNWNNKPWDVMTNDFKYLITEALFTDFAKLGSGVFNKDWLFSAYGNSVSALYSGYGSSSQYYYRDVLTNQTSLPVNMGDDYEYYITWYASSSNPTLCASIYYSTNNGSSWEGGQIFILTSKTSSSTDTLKFKAEYSGLARLYFYGYGTITKITASSSLTSDYQKFTPAFVNREEQVLLNNGKNVASTSYANVVNTQLDVHSGVSYKLYVKAPTGSYTLYLRIYDINNRVTVGSTLSISPSSTSGTITVTATYTSKVVVQAYVTSGNRDINYVSITPTNNYVPKTAIDWMSGYAHFGGDSVHFNPNGSGWLAEKNIEWNENGNLDVTGALNVKNSSNVIKVKINGDDFSKTSGEDITIVDVDGIYVKRGNEGFRLTTNGFQRWNSSAYSWVNFYGGRYVRTIALTSTSETYNVTVNDDFIIAKPSVANPFLNLPSSNIPDGKILSVANAGGAGIHIKAGNLKIQGAREFDQVTLNMNDRMEFIYSSPKWYVHYMPKVDYEI